MNIILILKRADILAASVVLTGAVMSGCSPADDSTQVEDTKVTTTTDTEEEVTESEETEPATEPDTAESDQSTNGKKTPEAIKVNPSDERPTCLIYDQPVEGTTPKKGSESEGVCEKQKPPKSGIDPEAECSYLSEDKQTNKNPSALCETVPVEPGTLDKCRAPKPDKHGKIEEDCLNKVPLGD